MPSATQLLVAVRAADWAMTIAFSIAMDLTAIAVGLTGRILAMIDGTALVDAPVAGDILTVVRRETT